MAVRRRRGDSPLYAIQALEQRCLLTVVSGTENADSIVLTSGTFSQQVYVNGVLVVDAAFTDLTINGLGGNDAIQVLGTSFQNGVIKINGGGGDDTITVGDGDFSASIDTIVNVTGGSGSDSVILNDQTNSDPDDFYITLDDVNNGPSIYSDETLAYDGEIDWDSSIENEIFNYSSANNNIYVEYEFANITLNLGGGTNTVTYGGSQHEVFGFVPPMSVNGGTGTDTVIFNDQNSGTTGRLYDGNASSILNQTLTGVEVLAINTRVGSIAAPNTIEFTGGFPVSQMIVLTGSGTNNQLNLGTAANPVDLNDYNLAFNANITSTNYIHSADTENNLQLFVLQTITGPNRQQVNTGGFTGTFNTADPLTVHGGPGDDSFAIGGVLAGSFITIEGDDGNDALYTVSNNGHDNDLDELFTGSFFAFNGQNGTDSLDLNDSADQTNDNDAMYYVGGGWLAKGSSVGFNASRIVSYDATTDNINVVASSENNTFTIAGVQTQHFTIDGGDGNDTFLNYSGYGLEAGAGLSTIIGGNGTDILSLVDTIPGYTAITEYRFDPNVLSYYAGSALRGGYAYDGTLEQLGLDENNNGTTSQIKWKPLILKMSINANGGDDTMIVGGGDIDSNGFTTATFTVTGGNGNDAIVYNDISDDITIGESEIYNIETTTVTKGSAGVSYSTFETETFNVATINSPGSINPQTVNINSPNGSFTSTMIHGGGSRATVVNMGNPFITNIPGSITVNGGGANMTVNYNDAVGTGNRQYLVESNEVYLSTNLLAHLFYSNVTTLNVNAGSGNDQILIEGIPAGTTVNAHGNDGNDLIVFGNFGSFFSTMLGNGNAYGDGGTDEVRWASFDSAAINATLTTSALTHLTHVYSYSGFEKLWINFFNTAALALALQSTNIPTSVTGGGGADTITIGGGNYANIQANVTVNGGNGDDTVVIDDHLNGFGPSYTLSSGDLFTPFTVQGIVYSVDSDNIEHISVVTGAGNDAVSVEQSSIDLFISTGDGDDIINVKNSALPVRIDTGPENGTGLFFQGDFVTVNSNAFSSGPDTDASVRFAQNDRLWGLSLFNNGVSASFAQIAAGVTVDVTNTISLAGTIDLAGGNLLLGSAAGLTPAQARSAIIAGRNNGAWNGTSASGAINSSTAAGSSTLDGVGYGLGSQIAISSIGGFPIAPGDTLFRYTLEGDANLNGAVNAADLGVLSLNWQGNSKVFSQADFNYDNKVDLWDLYGLSKNFNQTLPPAPASPVALPLPTRAPTRSATRTINLVQV